MEQVKSAIQSCLIALVLVGLLMHVSTAASIEHRLQKRSLQEATNDDVFVSSVDPDQTNELEDQNGAWQILYEDQLRRELKELDRAEELIMDKLKELNTERETIREKKRGHTQCFLNLVSCYRKRK